MKEIDVKVTYRLVLDNGHTIETDNVNTISYDAMMAKKNGINFRLFVVTTSEVELD